MRKLIFILSFFMPVLISAQVGDSIAVKRDSIKFSGQISAWGLYNNNNTMPLWIGGRYIPQLNYGYYFPDNRLWDIEVSLNINGIAGFNPFSANEADGTTKLYRSWIRYSGEQFEVRLGLQKLNFGSASMLRPLMWFDRLDPRDPLQLTDGVWGVLARYYFLNNANLWAWMLYGNEKPSVWEVVETNENVPEFGARIQMPLPKGEIGFTWHHRTADSRKLVDLLQAQNLSFERIPENKLGIDGKWDIAIGLWIEASWTHKERDVDVFTNQHLLNIGADYTFGIGNGLNTIVEHLVANSSLELFEFYSPSNFTALSFSYPLGLSDNISAITYYDWRRENLYNYINWNRNLNKFTLYAIAFFNPEINALPVNGDSFNLMGGNGIQIMVVYNY